MRYHRHTNITTNYFITSICICFWIKYYSNIMSEQLVAINKIINIKLLLKDHFLLAWKRNLLTIKRRTKNNFNSWIERVRLLIMLDSIPFIYPRQTKTVFQVYYLFQWISLSQIASIIAINYIKSNVCCQDEIDNST